MASGISGTIKTYKVINMYFINFYFNTMLNTYIFKSVIF
nr:MAG TPA: hypothetical protein [Caudoviricetes sp.]DAM32943.1 MAG TPA: hypothetical protein [Caudoviricetes sp.]